MRGIQKRLELLEGRAGDVPSLALRRWLGWPLTASEQAILAVDKPAAFDPAAVAIDPTIPEEVKAWLLRVA